MELYGTAIDILIRNVSGISIVVTEYFMICVWACVYFCYCLNPQSVVTSGTIKVILKS